MEISEEVLLYRSKDTMSCILGLLLVVFASVAYATSSIKKSNSGICHPPESGWYDRTEDYEAFDSITACIESGGRLPKAMSLSLHASTRHEQAGNRSEPSYERERFGAGWADVDGDCQDSRAEALIETSSTPVRFSDSRRCRVIAGRWVSPFTGQVIQNSGDIDIDHVVPLRWAWEHGAALWTQEKREKFANDPRNLWPVELSLNRSKGARGPDDWLPPSGQCLYTARFVRIVRIFELNLNEAEQSAFQSILERC